PRLPAEDQPLDLLAHLLRSARTVDVERDVVRPLEAGLHGDPVDRLAVLRPEGPDPHAAGRYVAQARDRPARKEEERLAKDDGALDRPEEAVAVGEGDVVVDRHDVVPAVLLPRLRIDGDPRQRPEPLPEARDQLVQRPPRFVPDRRAAA